MNRTFTVTEENIKAIMEKYPEANYAFRVLFPNLIFPTLYSGAVLTHRDTQKRYLLAQHPSNTRRYHLIDTETGYQYRGMKSITFRREGDEYFLTTEDDISMFHVNSIGNVRARKR